MKNIYKSTEPPELKEYRNRFSSVFQRWTNLKKNQKTLTAIHNTLAKDQKGLCAYCEIALHEENRSVEHFIPCHKSTKENNHDLDWLNMFAICRPPGGLTENDLQSSQLPHNFPCCGLKKYDFVPDGRLLNPLNLQSVLLFTVSSLDGEIRPDEIACRLTGVSIEYAQFTIEKLGLNVQRLKNERLRKVKEIEEEREILDDGIISKIDLDKKIAQMFFRDGTKNWPPFFTTIRSILGEGAEQHLKEISYSG
jgi:uncharacterized protein (TIGR02646 family)